MKIKKSLLNFIHLAGACFLVLSCVTDPIPEEKPQKAKETEEQAKKTTGIETAAKTPSESDRAIASPITPDLIVKYPHLEGYEGEILIGNPAFQAVLSGVPLARDESGEYKGLIALFTQNKKSWHRSTLWQKMTFKRLWDTKDHFIPIGLNVENNEKTKSSTATIIFSPAGKRQPTIKLNFHVFADKNWIIIENPSAHPSSRKEQSWDVTWSSDFGEQLLVQETEFQSPATLRYFENEVMGHVGEINSTGKVSVIPHSTFQILDKEKSPKNILHFFIGRDANTDISSQAVINKKCLNSFKVSGGSFAVFKQVNLAAYVECFRKNDNLEKMTSIVNSFDEVGQYFVVTEKSRKINYLYLDPQSELKISSQNQPSFQLENSLSSRRTPFTTTTAPSRLRALKTKFGNGRIINQQKDDLSGVYLIRMLSHISPNSIKVAPSWELEQLDTNLWKGNTWPINFRVPEGYYRVEVFNLKHSKSCTAVIEIKEKIQAETLCQFPEAENTGAFSGNFENYQLLHSLNQSNKNLETEKTVLRSKSKENNQTLRVYPVNSEIKKDWENFRKQRSNESEFLSLGQFSSQLGAGINREWLCPESRISKKLFSAIVRQIKPNALQIFGCDTLSISTAEAIEITREITGSIPLILPNTQNQALSPLSSMPILIAESGKPEDQIFLDGKVLERLSQNAKYSLSQGAMIKINTPLTHEIILRPGGQSEEISFDIEVKALWPHEVTSLIIEQSDGKVFRREIKISSGEYAITKFSTLVKSQVKWIQIHLVGKVLTEYPGLFSSRESEFILATSSPFTVVKDGTLNN